MKKSTILVTGASGFVGRSLCRSFMQHDEVLFRPVVRSLHTSEYGRNSVVMNIGPDNDWTGVLEGVGRVVHLAARVHVMKESEQDPLTAFRSVNVAGTLNLARHAAAAGVQRFVFLSSIKVNGEVTGDTPFRCSDAPAPADPYAVSKLEAEQGLLKISRESGLEVVIVRPPLVYGQEAGGNFARLRWLAARGWPLPLGGIHNQRSLIGIENLCDCINICLYHSEAAGKTFLVSDNHDISTPDLVRLLASSVGRTAHLPSLPVGILQMAAKICGRGSEVKRLTENLQIDCSDTMRLLNWQPVISLEEGIKRSVI